MLVGGLDRKNEWMNEWTEPQSGGKSYFIYLKIKYLKNGEHFINKSYIREWFYIKKRQKKKIIQETHKLEYCSPCKSFIKEYWTYNFRSHRKDKFSIVRYDVWKDRFRHKIRQKENAAKLR